MSTDNVTPIRPRSEVPRGSNPLPPKSRRRYQRDSGLRDGYIGRFQKPMRWAAFGKVIFPDLRPCWRCTLGPAACATCKNPRRATAENEESAPVTQVNTRLAEKCARSLALMREAQRLVKDVLEDPEYRPGVLPSGVVPSGVDDYLDSAIGMLEEELPEEAQPT